MISTGFKAHYDATL